MRITKEALYPYLIYNMPIPYTKDLILHPIKMKDILDFNLTKSSILVRKNSTFPVKSIIKMSYLDFLFYCFNNTEFAIKYEMPMLTQYYLYAFRLMQLVFKDQDVIGNSITGGFTINNVEITGDQFDDIRRIIIIQNGIDFDIDEFIHYDTEKKLTSAQDTIEKESATIEDYIDSLCLEMHLSEHEIAEMSVRKFWRYIKRIKKRETFTIMKTAECGGMVTFKDPVEYWMTELDVNDKFENVKTDSQTIKQMVSG